MAVNVPEAPQFPSAPLEAKIDKVPGAVAGNLARFVTGGGVEDAGLPSNGTFPPSAHTHDDRYYTETETDSLLNTKSNTGHAHAEATESASGFMSMLDFVKLRGMGSGVLVVFDDGTSKFFAPTADTDEARGGALLSALAAASAGSVIGLSVGVFLLGATDRFSVPDDSVLIGAGMRQTTIKSPATERIIRPGNRSRLADFKIHSTATGSVQYAYPIGASSGIPDAAFTDAVFERLWIVADSDAIVITVAGCSFSAYDCLFETKYDGVFLNAGSNTARLYNCETLVVGPSTVSNPTTGSALRTGNATATLEVYGGRAVATGNGTANYAANCGDGTLRLYGVSLSASGTGAAELRRNIGTLVAAGVSKADGGALVTNGTITYGDRYARKLSISSFAAGGQIDMAGVRFAVSDASSSVCFPGASNGAWGVNNVANNAGLFRVYNDGNVALNSAGSFGGGVKVLSIANATTLPATNPAGGGVIYCEAGALKFKGSGGTVTTIAPA